MSQQAAVIGLGKLGAPLAGVIAAAGIGTCVYDRHHPTLRMVAERIAPVPEAGLQELLERAGNRLRPCVSIADAVRLSDISFVVVPTPSGVDGRFDLDAIVDVMEEIGSALASEPDYHVVVITSTVNPGDTSGPIRAALEQASGRTCGSDFGLVYNPEFIALGSVIKDMMTPDFLLIGSDDDRATEAVLDIYRRIHQDLPPVAILIL
jgi:UDPglucose 6-dehydrogenase